MNHLYVGGKKIGKAVIKSRVNTDFITAGPDDIVAGKISVDANYETIVGTMTNENNLVDLTSNATANPSDITAGKTGWAKGVLITGTTVRKTPNFFVQGNLKSFKVANNNVINAGDFVKFVEGNDGQSMITMVALASDDDVIDGLSNTYGNGNLYGGDTVDIIVPNT